MFAEFIKERQYLQNVSPRTIGWYQESFKWLSEPSPNQAQLKAFVIKMREKGLKPSSCNNRIRAVNAYLKWCESPLRIPKLKEEQRVLPTFSLDDIQKIVKWKPVTFGQRRLQVLMLTLIDTGCRIEEVLSLRWQDVDFDNLLLKVIGKGDKQRIIPMSFELRRHLWKRKTDTMYVFSTRQGLRLRHRDTYRDVHLALEKIGVTPPARMLHAFRHTFAVNYLRRGGSVFHLQKCLGHSSLEMTRRYASLQTADLSAVHQQVSLLRA